MVANLVYFDAGWEQICDLKLYILCWKLHSNYGTWSRQSRRGRIKRNHKYGFYHQLKDVKSVKLRSNIAAEQLLVHILQCPINVKMMEMITLVFAVKREELKLILL